MKTIILLVAVCALGELVHGLDNTLTWNGKVYKNTVNKGAIGDTNINNNPNGRTTRSLFLESEDENSKGTQRETREIYNINNGQATVQNSGVVKVGRQRRSSICCRGIPLGRCGCVDNPNFSARQRRDSYNINNGQAIVQNSGLVKVGREQRDITNIMASNPNPPAVSGIVNISGRTAKSLDFVVDPNATLSKSDEVLFVSSTGERKKLRKKCLAKVQQLEIDDSGVSASKTGGVKISSGIVDVTGAKEVGIGRQRRTTQDVPFRNRCDISGKSDENIYYVPAASAPLGTGSVKVNDGHVRVSNVDYVGVGRVSRGAFININTGIRSGRF